jgi:glycosyltransferase involved in cell wall biosynthesis
VREAGLAGTTIYAWSDDWFTGGHQIEDWAFGLTRRDRSPKPAYAAVKEGFARTPRDLLGRGAAARLGGRVLLQRRKDACPVPGLAAPGGLPRLRGDPGGRRLHGRHASHRGAFPEVKAIHQDNQGLSHARNVGLRAATGTIVAYTDSDCFADPDWLTYLVLKMREPAPAAWAAPT